MALIWEVWNEEMRWGIFLRGPSIPYMSFDLIHLSCICFLSLTLSLSVSLPAIIYAGFHPDHRKSPVCNSYVLPLKHTNLLHTCQYCPILFDSNVICRFIPSDPNPPPPSRQGPPAPLHPSPPSLTRPHLIIHSTPSHSQGSIQKTWHWPCPSRAQRLSQQSLSFCSQWLEDTPAWGVVPIQRASPRALPVIWFRTWLLGELGCYTV